MALEYAKKILQYILYGGLVELEQQKKPIYGQTGLSILEQLKPTINYAFKKHIYNDSLIRIEIMMLENSLHNKRDRKNCQKIICSLDEYFSRHKRLNKLLQTSYLIKAGSFYFQTGYPEKGVEQLNKAIALIKAKDKNNPKFLEDYLEAKNHMLKYFFGVADLKEAKKIYAELKAILDDQKTAKLLDNVTIAYARAHFYEAESYIYYLEGNCKAALKSIDKVFYNVNVISTHLHLLEFPYYICAYIFQKKYLYLSVLDENSNTYGEFLDIYNKSLKQADSSSNRALGELLIVLGDRKGVIGTFEEAKKIILHGIDILEKWYGYKYNNSVLAHAKILLGDLYARYGYNIKAQEEYLLALSVLKTSYKQLNVDDVSRLLHKMVTNYLILNDVFHAKQFRLMHINIFGERHPRSIDINNQIKDLL